MERRPDIQFQPDNEKPSTLVIEVAWTQRQEKLKELANEYILGTNAAIRTVIGFDVETSGGKRVTVTVWRGKNDKGNITIIDESTVQCHHA